MDYLDSQIQELENQIAANTELLGDPEMAPLAKAEIETLNQQKQALTDSQNQIAAAKEKAATITSYNNCIIETRPGPGGGGSQALGE